MPTPPNRPRRALAAIVAAGLLILLLVSLADQGRRLEGAPEPALVATGDARPSATPRPLRAELERVAAAVRWLESVNSTTTTTTTTVPSPSSSPRRTAPSASSSGTISSTAYCLTGNMANGTPARRGAVAANRWPIGTRLRVSPSPVGEIVTVEDRIGSGSELDFALPGDCAGARAWGRRAVSVEVLE